MKHTEPAATRSDLASERDGLAARRRRDRELTMSERLERVHELCAQLARLRPIARKRSG